VGTQPTPISMSTYSDAVDRFTKSATAFIEQVHHLTEARDAYQEAMAVSAALRNSLDAGDEALRTLMARLEQAIDVHFGKRAFDKKKPEPVKVEAIRANGT
jgi:hypothetical protein